MKPFIFRNQSTAYWFLTAALLAIILLTPAAWAETESLQGLFPETDYDTSAPITIFVANQLVTEEIC
jgi:hypothetical protein